MIVVLNSYKIFVNKLSLCSKAKLWLVIICFLPLFGCAASSPVANQELPCLVFPNPDSISMAVLPFMDKTGTNGMAKMIRDAFYGHLSVRRYRDIELHVVDSILEARDLSDPEVLYNLPIKELGRILDSDALVVGEITTYQKLFLGVYSQMAVGATITIWDSRSGQIVWSDRYVARLHEGGIPFSLFEIPLISFRSGYNLREKVKMRTVDELSRYLTGRIPEPASALYTSQVAESCPRDETGITNLEITARQQALSEEVDGQNSTIPPMF
jgi:hypothetical protein